MSSVRTGWPVDEEGRRLFTVRGETVPAALTVFCRGCGGTVAWALHDPAHGVGYVVCQTSSTDNRADWFEALDELGQPRGRRVDDSLAGRPQRLDDAPNDLEAWCGRCRRRQRTTRSAIRRALTTGAETLHAERYRHPL